MPQDYAEISEHVKAEAASWIARLHSDRRAVSDELLFREWLSASPEHQAAFDAVTRVWDAAGALTRERALVQPIGFQTTRRVLLAGVGAFVAAGASMTIWQKAQAGVYETEVGAQKHVELSDHTSAFLDSDTKIRERFDDVNRAVDLVRGRANFHVARDARPFVIEAAGHRVVASRANLDVRRDDSTVSVLLLQGNATVSSNTMDGREGKLLTQGDHLVATSVDRLKIDRPNLAPLIAWQTGQAIFENEMLRDAVREMNRYSVVKLTLADSTVARMRLSGVYRVGDNLAFAQSVATLLPVKLQVYGDRFQLVVDRSRMPEG